MPADSRAILIHHRAQQPHAVRCRVHHPSSSRWKDVGACALVQIMPTFSPKHPGFPAAAALRVMVLQLCHGASLPPRPSSCVCAALHCSQHAVESHAGDGCQTEFNARISFVSWPASRNKQTARPLVQPLSDTARILDGSGGRARHTTPVVGESSMLVARLCAPGQKCSFACSQSRPSAPTLPSPIRWTKRLHVPERRRHLSSSALPLNCEAPRPRCQTSYQGTSPDSCSSDDEVWPPTLRGFTRPTGRPML